ncbi:MAG: hypothetical protein M0R75_14975, partial [Dehalococcoidia bacterium]|nr:hypothetical protein [Dehalococcoidia bacterium]
MKAIILGGAECVWDDVDALQDLWGDHPWDGLTIAANDIACHWPRRRSDWTIIDPSFHVDAWCTLHPERLAGWIDLRAANGLPPARQTWAHEREPHHTIRGWEHVGHQLCLRDVSPPSGLFACYVARALGVTEGYLCGVPMTMSPHFHGSAEHEAAAAWPYADVYWPAWISAHASGDLAHVRSMSGRTRDLLGGPRAASSQGDAVRFSGRDGSFPGSSSLRVRG